MFFMICPEPMPLHEPFVLSLWFDRLTMIGPFPNVLSGAEGRAQGERLFVV
jgi:hypothetical protein